MLKGLKERDKLQSVFLEVLDDPYKKELFIYLICYIQMVRREGNTLVELSRYLSCSSNSFKRDRYHWKDILVELNLFYILDTQNRIYTGKDIYKVDEGDINLIGLAENYVKNFEEFSYRVTKYWNIVNKVHARPTRFNIHDSVYLACLIFNEELYEEALLYSETCSYRFPNESKFFEAIKFLSLMEGTAEKDEKIRYAQSAIKELSVLGDIYYEVNVGKLIQDINDAVRKIQKGKPYDRLKVEFVDSRRKKDEGFLKRVVRWIKRQMRHLKGGKKWTLDSSETAFCYSIDHCWKRQIKLKTQS